MTFLDLALDCIGLLLLYGVARVIYWTVEYVKFLRRLRDMGWKE